MKSLILTVLALATLSDAHAIMRPFVNSPSVLVKSARVEGNFMPPVDAETRPVHVFSVEFRACRTFSAQNFEVKVVNSPLMLGRNRGTRSAVTFNFKQPVADCFGPTHLQEVELSTTEIPLYSSVTVTNALLLEDATTH